MTLRKLRIDDSATVHDAKKASYLRQSKVSVNANLAKFYSEHRPEKTRTNQRNFRSLGPLMGFDAFHLVGELLTQPIQVIVGGQLGTTFQFEDGKQLFEGRLTKKDLMIIDGAGHNERYVNHAVERLSGSYREYL